MLRSSAALGALAIALTSASPPAAAQRWDDVTADTIGATAEWTNKVELADLDGDGWIDVVFANGGNYATAGTPEPQRVWRNRGAWDGPAPWLEEITAQVFGAAAIRLSRVIKARDVDGDGDVDLFVGGAHGTAPGLFLRDGDRWLDRSGELPDGPLHLGDAELGDVDGDGDLDLVLADWGGPPQQVDGGRVRLWLNDGAGAFVDATEGRLPDELVGMSWDLELVDVDSDGDLDLLVSCKLCDGGRLYINDGTGTFTDESADRLPQRPNNYDYEPIDVDGDGDLDLVTINDGPQLRETILINDGTGRFTDETATWLPDAAANPAGVDDNVAIVLDVDDDGDADLLIGALDSRDRLLRNDGDRFTAVASPFPVPTPGTLGLAAADLDGDRRLDLVLGAGETALPDAVFLAGDGVAIDTRPPHVRVIRPASVTSRRVVARIHDRRSPSVVQLRRVTLEITSAGTFPPVAMTWRGEHLWTAVVPGDDPHARYRLCASDLAGNEICTPSRGLVGAPDAGPEVDAGDDVTTDPGGCCQASGSPAGPLALTGVVALAVLAVPGAGARRRRRGGVQSRR